MSTTSVPWAGLWVTLYVRGFLLLAAAAIAIRWPDKTLLGMTAVAGGVVAALGVFEYAIVSASNASRRTKGLVALHALMSVAFGALAIAARFAAPDTTRDFAAVWLLLQSALVLAVARHVPSAGHARGVLLAWSAANVVCAFVVAAHPVMPLPGLLYIGAAYTAVYGVIQIAAALWIRDRTTLASGLSRLGSTSRGPIGNSR